MSNLIFNTFILCLKYTQTAHTHTPILSYLCIGKDLYTSCIPFKRHGRVVGSLDKYTVTDFGHHPLHTTENTDINREQNQSKKLQISQQKAYPCS